MRVHRLDIVRFYTHLPRMAERSGAGNDSKILQVNERIKHVATAVTAWGNALVIAAGGKWALTGFDPYVLLWFVCALALIWAASQSLTMLQEAE